MLLKFIILGITNICQSSHPNLNPVQYFLKDCVILYHWLVHPYSFNNAIVSVRKAINVTMIKTVLSFSYCYCPMRKTCTSSGWCFMQVILCLTNWQWWFCYGDKEFSLKIYKSYIVIILAHMFQSMDLNFAIDYDNKLLTLYWHCIFKNLTKWNNDNYIIQLQY